MPTFRIEKIDKEFFKKIDTRPDVTVLNVKELQKQKAEIEAEVVRLNQHLAVIQEIIAEYNKLP